MESVEQIAKALGLTAAQVQGVIDHEARCGGQKSKGRWESKVIKPARNAAVYESCLRPTTGGSL